MISYETPRRIAPRHHGRAVVEDVRIASHEAAHAVVRFHQGRNISAVTITREVGEDGRITNGRVRGSASGIDDDLDAFDRLIGAVAGDVGEHLHQGQCKGLRGSDKADSEFFSSLLCESRKAAGMLIAVARVEAEHILEENWIGFNKLIDVLLERRSMTGDDVISLLERHAPRGA